MIRYQKPLQAPVRESGKGAHTFAVGQRVRRKSRFGQPGVPSELYVVTRTLPPSGGVLQYRIRSEDERHERMTTEDDLEAVEAQVDTKPLERTI